MLAESEDEHSNLLLVNEEDVDDEYKLQLADVEDEDDEHRLDEVVVSLNSCDDTEPGFTVELPDDDEAVMFLSPKLLFKLDVNGGECQNITRNSIIVMLLDGVKQLAISLQ